MVSTENDVAETSSLENYRAELDRTKKKLKKYKKKQKMLCKLEKSSSIWRDDEKKMKKERKKLKKKICEYSENRLKLEHKLSELQLKIRHCREDKALLERSIPLQIQLQKQQDYMEYMQWFSTMVLKEIMPTFIKKYGIAPKNKEYIDIPCVERLDDREDE